MKKNKMCIMLDDTTFSLFRRPLEKNNKWKISYLSGLNFTENKQGFPYHSLKEPIILPVTYFASRQRRLLHTWYAKTPHNSDMQIREFKSQRNIKMELDRNPTIMSRIKKWLGLSSNLHVVQHIFYSGNFLIRLKNIRTNGLLKHRDYKRIY